jgi:DNA-binding response OmpR family regulator
MRASILIMTDDAPLREQLRRVAEEFGRVVVTHKPALAIYFAAVHEPRLAILDLDAVPERGRSGLVSTLRVRFRASLIAIGDLPALADAAELGLPMLLKPPDVADLTVAIERGLRSEQAERDRG